MVMYRLLIQAQSLCNPVLGDAKAVHAKYFDVKVHLVHSAKIGYTSTVFLFDLVNVKVTSRKSHKDVEKFDVLHEMTLM
jgi:hypothetical protein